MEKLDILAVGAHPDDVEIGMGGTVAKLLEAGWRVGILDLTNGEPTPLGSVEKRLAESREAARILAVNERVTLDLPNRYLADTIEARTKVAEVIRRFRPDILFLPYWQDAHPDHVAASQLADAARFYAKLTKTEMRGEPFYPRRVFYFFCTHLRLHPDPSFIFDVGGAIDRKIAAVASYHSQFNEERANLGILERVRETAAYWGSLIRVSYGEPFACKETIGLNGLRELV